MHPSTTTARSASQLGTAASINGSQSAHSPGCSLLGNADDNQIALLTSRMSEWRHEGRSEPLPTVSYPTQQQSKSKLRTSRSRIDAIGPKQESAVRQVPGHQQTVARAQSGMQSPARLLKAGFQSTEACLRVRASFAALPDEAPSPR